MDAVAPHTEVAADRAASPVVDAQRQAARGLRLTIAFLLAASPSSPGWRCWRGTPVAIRGSVATTASAPRSDAHVAAIGAPPTERP